MSETKVRGGARAIGLHAARALKPTFDERGFNVVEVLNNWPAIVGAEYAAFTAPERVNWPKRPSDETQAAQRLRRKPEGATLVLRVDGPRAIEVQHRSNVILDRINTYFGWQAITSLRFVQAPVARKTQSKTPRAMPTEATIRAHANRLDGLASEDLRQAFARLGAAMEASRGD